MASVLVTLINLHFLNAIVASYTQLELLVQELLIVAQLSIIVIRHERKYLLEQHRYSGVTALNLGIDLLIEALLSC